MWLVRGGVVVVPAFLVLVLVENVVENGFEVDHVVLLAAFAMPNGSTSVVLLNRGEQTVEYTLRDKATGREAELSALAHSAQSFIF